MMSSNDALFFYIFNPENPTCNINAEFMFNFVIQDTLISPLVLLLDFLDTQDYLSGSSISPKLESAFHGEIFESLFQIEINNIITRLGLIGIVIVAISQCFDLVYTLNQATVGGGLPSTSNWMQMVCPSVPWIFSHGFPGNFTASPLGTKGFDCLSQSYKK